MDDKITTADLKRYADLRRQLDALSEAERDRGSPMFINRPDAWFEAGLWRCINGHVSTRYLKSEETGLDLCLECEKPLALTFPEDTEGTPPPEPYKVVSSQVHPELGYVEIRQYLPKETPDAH